MAGEVLWQLRCVQEAYQRSTVCGGSPGKGTISGEKLCSDILSLANHIRPAIVPDSLLVKLWMSVKDETLKQVYLRGSKSKHSAAAQPCSATTEKLIQAISVFLSQCPDLPFDLFWEECAHAFIQIACSKETEVAVYNIYSARKILQGLLHLMAVNSVCRSPFTNSKFDETSLARLFIFLRLILEENKEADEPLANLLFPKWDAYNTSLSTMVRSGFQTILELFQSEAALKLEFNQPARRLLKDLRLVNEDEWIACFATLLHQVLQAYLEKGPTLLEQEPTKTLLKLFSRRSLAQLFLDCITLYPEPHADSGYATALSAAFQIFELVHREHSQTIITCCLTKAVDEQSDMVFLRLQCLNLVGRIQSSKWNLSENTKYTLCIWTDEAMKTLFAIILRDSSIRVRRSAMKIFMHSSASMIAMNKKEVLEVCLMKVRDQDEKVRLLALQTLRKFPMKTLTECLTDTDWNVICKRGFSEDKKEICGLAEVLLLDYITTDMRGRAPSARLRNLGLLAEGDWSEKHFSFLCNHVEAIFDREIDHLDSYVDMDAWRLKASDVVSY